MVGAHGRLAIRLRPLPAPDLADAEVRDLGDAVEVTFYEPTCDWGACARPSDLERWSESLGRWLPACLPCALFRAEDDSLEWPRPFPQVSARELAAYLRRAGSILRRS